jgi:uncharacterized membrane protein
VTADRLLEGAAVAIVERWLMALNTLNGLIFAGTFVSPLLLALGAQVAGQLAFVPYRALCLQRPDHSFFIFGYQMAMEQRMVAIYASLFWGGVIYGWLRGRPRGALPLWAYIILSFPMALDVATQTVGLRASDWVWRLVTGALFGIGSVAFLYPRLDQAFRGALSFRRTAPASSARTPRG